MVNYKKYKKRLNEVLKLNELRILPGNIAFFFVLALIPMITVIVRFFSGYVNFIVNLINEIFPSGASNLIINFISSNNTVHLTFNIFTFIIASNGTLAIVNSANTLYHVDNRDFIKDRVKALILLFILLILLVFLIFVPVLGGIILGFFSKYSFYSKLLFIYNLLKWPITIFLIFFVLKIIYVFAPDRVIKSSETTKGALFTTFIWTICTFVFGFYLQNIANFNQVYGNLANIIILMMWLYIISYVFVVGMAINYVKYQEDK